MTKSKYGRMNLINMFCKATKAKIYKSLGIRVVRPYMKEREIAMFLEIFAQNNLSKVLEYGCGFSSIYYSGFLPENARWISIEHNEEWYENIKKQIGANVDLFLVPSDDKDVFTPSTSIKS